MPERMKAAHIVSPRRLEIVDVPIPNLAEIAGEPILVKLHAGVLCASDFPRWQGGAFNVTFPRPVGDSLHECVGEVIESRSPKFRPGDLTLAIPPDQRGLSELFVADGSMAVPLPVAPGFPRERLILGQPLGTIVWAARKLPNLLGLDVAIVGQGPIGLMFDHLLANMGARRVIALDKIDYRLQVARKMKATHTVNVGDGDPVAAVREITDGPGADIVVEAVGHQVETVHLAISLVRKHGTVLAFGVPDEQFYPLPVWDLMLQNIRFISSIHPQVERDLPLALAMILEGRMDVAPLITHRFAFEQSQAAFELAVERRDNPIKVLLTSDTSSWEKQPELKL
jgi:threonine dehydrogenase-like Zn-dependent dehydrogenase